MVCVTLDKIRQAYVKSSKCLLKAPCMGHMQKTVEHLSTTSQRQLLKTMQGIKILNNQRHGTFKYQFTKATPKNNTRHQNLEQSKTWNI
jgi:hypothetical protein